MSGLNAITNIAKTGLMTAQTAIQVTANNIANVNNPDYKRQRVNMSSASMILSGGTIIGTGVAVDGIERVYDRFLQLQIYNSKSSLGRYSKEEYVLSRLEAVFNDLEGYGLTNVLNEFFNAVQDTANDPTSYAARVALLGKGDTLAARINGMESRIRQQTSDINKEISGKVSDVNNLASQVASINQEILKAESSGGTANDLRDKRDALIKSLSEYIDITVLDNNDGQKTILAAGGNPLVESAFSAAMGVRADANNDGNYDVVFPDVTGGYTDITDNISSGSLKGLINTRDNTFTPSFTKLKTIAASITKEFNEIHRAGYGLDGSTGNDFFNALTPDVTANSTNTGGALVTTSGIINLSQVTLSDYEIRFTSSTTFSIVDTTNNTVISTGAAYTSGANIDFDGIRVVITDTPGTPQAGDVFKVSITKNAAMNFGVSLTDANKFAAATQAAALPGDNRNALALAALKDDSTVLSNGTATFSTYYASIVADIGTKAQDSSRNASFQDVVVNQMENNMDSVSGVSMEEEAANLVKYQYAYQAAAKIITVVDDLFNTLVNLVR
ncbi:MAG: flagellar hook-associated protein FlgK [Deltaproteobacteria bacterium]|nr:flagellar hook-associated protein FlgK [Deltaproteobacteria bacterium]